ncbi:MAG: hypothetical protein CVU55_05485 [Deltaproteobacteria bacterium HGW-Deltaproteobacteria-13]|jgi:hypothetical protein|nr:MAG: hypothetical protein CVU55_05485 [Deltaproteobacteria bacterium HGW-Deltaproteobacteria-13]
MKTLNDLYPTPYDLKESLQCLLRICFRTGRKNPLDVQFIDKKICLNPIKKQNKIGFIGDIMQVMGKKVRFSPEMKDFFKGCDAIIGNFEATITNVEHQRVALRQDEIIIDDLKELFPPDKFYLSIANNHAGDFGETACRKSAQLLTDNGFHVFGFKESPFIDINENVRVWTGTMWSNEPCDYIARFDDLLDLKTTHPGNKNDHILFNICYPHWGYEIELYPRADIVNKGLLLLKEFDMVIGHHSHTVQPVANNIIDAVNKLTAYSLGDFCFCYNLHKYIYGEIVTAEIGPDIKDKWLAGHVNWSFIKSSPDKQEILVSLAGQIPFFPNL